MSDGSDGAQETSLADGEGFAIAKHQIGWRWKTHGERDPEFSHDPDGSHIQRREGSLIMDWLGLNQGVPRG